MSKQLAIRPRDRRGNILVLTAFMMMAMVAFLAFAIDIGYLSVARSELQKSADAAAMAAAWELIEQDPFSPSRTMSDEIQSARLRAQEYASYNRVCSTSPGVDLNYANSTAGDVVVGQ